jgi:hydroxymethylbilane synthase
MRFVIAAAGLKRLQSENKVREYFSINELIPPAGQGLLAIQCRTDDKERFFPLIKDFASESAMIRTRAEREFLRILQGGCKTPMAAHAQVTGDKIILQTFFADDSGKNTIKNIHTEQ